MYIQKAAMLGDTHGRILDFSFRVEQKHVAKWHYNWSQGLIVGAFCIVFRFELGPSGGVFGPIVWPGKRPNIDGS